MAGSSAAPTLGWETTPARQARGAVQSRTPLQLVLRQLRRNRGAVVGLAVLAAIALAAVLAPAIAPYDPIRMVPADRMQPPSTAHWFGTDLFGRDVLSRVLYGFRASLVVALVSVVLGTVFGVALGLMAGYAGGWGDATIMKLMDMLLAFPGILLALSIIALLGPGLQNAMIAVGISSIPGYARLTRGDVLAAKGGLYVDAARAVGCRHGRILIRHILPNVVAPVIVLSALNTAWAILTTASLSFLGLGVQPPTPELGALLNDGRNYLAIAPWITLYPGLAIMVTVMAINLLGDGLRDALDPRQVV